MGVARQECVWNRESEPSLAWMSSGEEDNKIKRNHEEQNKNINNKGRQTGAS